MPVVVAVDQGTTGTTVLVFDRQGRVVGRAYSEFTQHYPKPGWVEHDVEEIWRVTLRVLRQACRRARVRARDVAALGITNQRETTVLWERRSGRPVHRAIVWQDRRTASLCEELRARGLEDVFRQKTGLVLDPYFSGTKLRWLLEHVPRAAERARAGELAAGTIDTWLMWKLTGGAVHATDPTNASRTLLFDIHAGAWDAALCDLLQVPAAVLPAVKPSSGEFGATEASVLGAPVAIAGVAGDQQAALFGQGCVEPGMAKNTYGTGCFLLMNTGAQPVASRHGLVTTAACDARGGRAYALEGSVFIAGAAIQWLRDGLGLLKKAAESERLARGRADGDGGGVPGRARRGVLEGPGRARARAADRPALRAEDEARGARRTLPGVAGGGGAGAERDARVNCGDHARFPLRRRRIRPSDLCVPPSAARRSVLARWIRASMPARTRVSVSWMPVSLPARAIRASSRSSVIRMGTRMHHPTESREGTP